MKILHTADWHLGKIVHGASMLDEQKYILRQIIEIAKEEEIDAMIIAGDLYDRSIPSTEAIALLNDVLYELNVQRKIPIFAISGNHDSSERLAFGSAWYEQNKLFITAKLTADLTPINWRDSQFWLIPYHDTLTARAVLRDPNINSFDDAMQAIIAKIQPQQDKSKTQVLIGHAFVAGAEVSDSERALSVGNVERVATTNFAGFDYVALGHLHRPTALNHASIGYSGSPLKYSFSESLDTKSVRIVELAAGELLSVRTRELTPNHDLRKIAGHIDELLENKELHTTDYVQINLLDEGALLDPMGRLRKVFPNILHLERTKHQLGTVRTASFETVLKMEPALLFSEFFNYTTGKNITTKQAEIVKSTIEKTLKGGE